MMVCVVSVAMVSDSLLCSRAVNLHEEQRDMGPGAVVYAICSCQTRDNP